MPYTVKHGQEYVNPGVTPPVTQTGIPQPPPPPRDRQADAMDRLAGAAETFANSFARLVDIIGKLPAPGQGVWKKG